MVLAYEVVVGKVVGGDGDVGEGEVVVGGRGKAS